MRSPCRAFNKLCGCCCASAALADTDGADRTTLELNQPRAIVNVTDKQQAELSAAAAAAAPAPALHDPQPTDPAAAPPAAAEPQPPAGAAAPTMHQLQLLMPGPTIRRRLRGFRSLAVIPKPGAASGAPAAAAAAAAGAAGGPPGNKPPTKEGRKREAQCGPGPCSTTGTRFLAQCM
jgi:hypothetical protein